MNKHEGIKRIWIVLSVIWVFISIASFFLNQTKDRERIISLYTHDCNIENFSECYSIKYAEGKRAFGEGFYTENNLILLTVLMLLPFIFWWIGKGIIVIFNWIIDGFKKEKQND